MRVSYDPASGYEFDQEITVEAMLVKHGLDLANGVSTPVGEDVTVEEDERSEFLPMTSTSGPNVKSF